MNKKILFLFFVTLLGVPLATFGDFLIYQEIEILKILWVNIMEGTLFILGLVVGFWIGTLEENKISKNWRVTNKGVVYGINKKPKNSPKINR